MIKKFMEVELKYNAEGMKLSSFIDFCEGRKGLTTKIMVSGYDHFYSSLKQPDSFCRHRIGPDMNQLTFKRKTADANNFVRTEHNIDLTTPVSKAQIEALVKEFGYQYNFSIFKSCWVFKYDWHTFVYYICSDMEMQELGRFMEIEAAEDHNWASEAQAWQEITVLEKLCKPLGVTAQSRIKRSLYEMFKKEPK